MGQPLVRNRRQIHLKICGSTFWMFIERAGSIRMAGFLGSLRFGTDLDGSRLGLDFLSALEIYWAYKSFTFFYPWEVSHETHQQTAWVDDDHHLAMGSSILRRNCLHCGALPGLVLSWPRLLAQGMIPSHGTCWGQDSARACKGHVILKNMCLSGRMVGLWCGSLFWPMKIRGPT